MALPGIGAVGDMVLAMDTSAEGAALPVAVAELLVVLGSAVAVLVVAVLLRVPVNDGARVEVTVIVAVAPGARTPTAQARVLSPSTAQVPAVVVALAPPSAVASWSVTVTPVAVDGPALRTASVNVTGRPGTGLAGLIDLVITRSADGAVVPLTVAELLAVFGSAVGELAVAVLDSEPVYAAARRRD